MVECIVAYSLKCKIKENGLRCVLKKNLSILVNNSARNQCYLSVEREIYLNINKYRLQYDLTFDRIELIINFKVVVKWKLHM